MSKKAVIICSLVITFMLIVYRGWEAGAYEAAGTLDAFIGAYLNAAQKYLYMGMIFCMPIVVGTSIPYASPEMLIRLRTKIAPMVALKSIIVSFLLTWYVLGLHVIVGIFCGMEAYISVQMVQTFIRLFVFFLQCHFIFAFVYSLCGAKAVSTAVTVGINIVVLIIILADSFMYAVDDGARFMRIFVWYESLSFIIAAVLFILFALKRKDYLFLNAV